MPKVGDDQTAKLDVSSAAMRSGVNEVIRLSPSASDRLNLLKTSEHLFKA